VRIPLHIGNYFPTLVKYQDQVYVFDGVKDPEAYGAQLPYFNRPDPNFTTTTSTTTTTTTTTTTVAPTAPPTTPATPAPTPPKTQPPTTSAPTTTAASGAAETPAPAATG
jgi:hypothetical protein